MNQPLEFSAAMSGMGIYAVRVEGCEKDGEVEVTITREDDEMGRTVYGVGDKKFAEMSEEDARGVGIEVLTDTVQEDHDEGAFYSLFEDYDHSWTLYEGDMADEGAMMRFLDGLISTIEAAKRQVPMQADMEKYRREHPEKFQEEPVEFPTAPVIKGKPYIF